MSIFKLTDKLISYRKKMKVTQLSICKNDAYPVCPRCNVILDKEFIKFCYSCGQHLGWKIFMELEREDDFE